MVAETDWRDATNYQYLIDLTPSELAWEFLRRNPEYEREVAMFDSADEHAATALTAHWGLRFPDTAKRIRRRRTHLLEPGHRSGRPYSDRSDVPHHAHGKCHRRSRRHQGGG